MLLLNSFIHPSLINDQSDTCPINLPNLIIFTNSLAPSSLSDMHAFDTAWSCEILHCISTRACCATDAMEQSPIICHDASSHLLFYDANLWNKQKTMENIWIDMYPYPQDLLWQCWPSVELCILRFLHEKSWSVLGSSCMQGATFFDLQKHILNEDKGATQR